MRLHPLGSEASRNTSLVLDRLYKPVEVFVLKVGAAINNMNRSVDNLVRSSKKCFSNLLSLETFAVIHTLFGKYSMNCDSKLTSLLAKVYCVLVAAIFVVLRILYLSGSIELQFHGIMTILEYVIYTILYLYKTNKEFIMFCSEIKNIDTKMGLPEIVLVTTSWKYFLLRAIILRGFQLTLLALTTSSQINLAITSLTLISNDLTYAHRMIIFSILCEHMKLLKEKFIKDLQNSLDIEQNSVSIKISKLFKNLEMYENLQYAFNGLGLNFQISILTTFFIRSVKLLNNVYLSIIYLNSNDFAYTDFGFMTNILGAVHSFISISEMVVFMERSIQHLEELKLQLTTETLHCEDPVLAAELQHARICVGDLPVQLLLIRCVRVDANLPVSLLSLYLAYTIVIVQLNNLDFF